MVDVLCFREKVGEAQSMGPVFGSLQICAYGGAGRRVKVTEW